MCVPLCVYHAQFEPTRCERIVNCRNIKKSWLEPWKTKEQHKKKGVIYVHALALVERSFFIRELLLVFLLSVCVTCVFVYACGACMSNKCVCVSRSVCTRSRLSLLSFDRNVVHFQNIKKNLRFSLWKTKRTTQKKKKRMCYWCCCSCVSGRSFSTPFEKCWVQADRRKRVL